MWRMHDGDRVLTDGEWRLVAAGLDLLRDFVEADIRHGGDDLAETGVRVFDALTPEQKLALLADVAEALRDPSAPTPRHTAANEGAIAAVFASVRDLLAGELDADPDDGRPPTDIRQLIRLAAGECPERGRLPAPTRTSPEAWEDLLEEIEGRVFWDWDFAMGDQFLDKPPVEARALLSAYGIDPGYYLDVPREPDGRGLTAARQTLARLLGLVAPNDDGLYPALVDLYHDLTVGRCPPDAADEWGDHPWVELVETTEPAWDCDYAAWVADFRPALPAEPFALRPGGEMSAEGELPDGVRVEPHDGAWVVRDADGAYWCGLVTNCWTDHPDAYDAPLTFASEAGARSGYHQAARMYAERTVRRAAAAARLGLSE